jgi:hypothetical protein
MDVRRYYVVTRVGELGPFRLDELQEALDQGKIVGSAQVRTGLGTMLGTVADVLVTPETTWDARESGSGSSSAVSSRRPAQGRLVLVTLVLLSFPAFLTVLLMSRGGTEQPAKPRLDPSFPRPPVAVEPPRQPAQPPPAPVAPPRPPPAPVVAAPPSQVPPPAPAPVPDVAGQVVPQQPDGSLLIGAQYATFVDLHARVQGLGTPTPNIGDWNEKTGAVVWKVRIDRPGRFRVTLTYACAPAGAGGTYRLKIGKSTMVGECKNTTGWNTYESVPAGEIAITDSGVLALEMSSGKRTGSQLLKLRTIALAPIP